MFKIPMTKIKKKALPNKTNNQKLMKQTTEKYEINFPKIFMKQLSTLSFLRESKETNRILNDQD
jgi:hypothetical protein